MKIFLHQSYKRAVQPALHGLASLTLRVTFGIAGLGPHLPNARRSRSWFSLRCLQRMFNVRSYSNENHRAHAEHKAPGSAP